MLYPDFNELLDLQHKVKRLSVNQDRSSANISGDNRSKRYGSGLEFKEVREYVMGDDVRNIDWRVTARTNIPHSKLFKVQSEQTINIVVDMNANMHFGTKSTFKSVQAARLASLLSWFFNQGNNKVGGVIFGGEGNVELFPPAKSKQSLLRMLQSLCLQKISKEYTPLDHALSKLGRMVSSESRIYIISDFSNFNYKSILKDIKRFRERGCNISFLQIIDQRDYDIPAIGQISFVDMVGNDIEIDSSNKSGNRKYLELWENNQEQLCKLTNEVGIKLTRINTNDDVFLKLMSSL